jgi:DNA-binding transcriptional ArsR family regulator
MSKPAPGAETLRDAILEALAAGPMTKAELARRLALHGTSLGGHLAVLETRGRILIRAGRVGLPDQLPEGETKTPEEEQLEHFRQLWQQRGIAAICPADVQDSFLRQQICLLAMELYGRRGLSR